jgi:hypothetical protein
MLISDTATDSARSSLAPVSVIAGLALYLTSFFLPAVGGHPPMIGWQCAWLALMIPFREMSGVTSLVLLASGLINQLLLIYLSMRTAGARLAARSRVALSALCLIPMSWLFIAMMRQPVGIGHVLWAAGLLLIVLPDLIAFFRGEA